MQAFCLNINSTFIVRRNPDAFSPRTKMTTGAEEPASGALSIERTLIFSQRASTSSF